ncbi:uncharacterized protein BJ171DRAFT_486519 [Polychytrium aggregatum]|uniref:uncharacterized protein n=1 Tax=Polychytrium aggregatum TaxID=110093 RepID=UPI0022FE5CC4|nr:uncharacterized protein BJ171DRAFT_486519 [Polychytrium aggregatum]KAI9209344.1 hypothetical protein BJ171DRAFT_486519 [Polychytrium aggregatum]
MTSQSLGLLYDPVPSAATIALRSAFAAVFYSVLHIVAKTIAAQSIHPKIWNAFSNRDKSILAEKVCSTVNSLFIGGAGLYFVLVSDAFANADLFATYPPELDWVFPQLVGYTIYDTATMYLQGDWPMAMWIHHYMTLYATFGMPIYRRLAVLVVYFFITELTASIQNVIWFHQNVDPSALLSPETEAVELLKLKAKRSRTYAQLLFVRVCGFLFFRTWVVPYLLYLIPVLSGGWIPFVQTLRNEPLGLSIPAVLMFSMFGYINADWTIMAVRAWQRKTRGTAKDAKDAKEQ